MHPKISAQARSISAGVFARAMRRSIAAIAAIAIACAAVLSAGVSLMHAQEITDPDQAIGRARALVEAGNGRAGRLVLDSLVQRTPVGTPALGELLYWRGLLSESGADAERDWRRLLLEVPMSPRAEDALLRLAQMEQLRGRAAESRVLLERLLRDYSDPPSQARAHFWLAKAYFDENDRPRACGALEVARRDVPTSAVELRTQMDNMRSGCRGVTAVSPARIADAGGAPPPSATPPAAVQRASDSVRTPDNSTRTSDSSARTSDNSARTSDSSTRTPDNAARPANARYSVQLAAYARLDQAQALVRRLATRNVEARVDGTANPFRVRTGYFTTRAQANARLAELRRAGHDGFVAELMP